MSEFLIDRMGGVIYATCLGCGADTAQPDKGLGRAFVATWKTRHQHAETHRTGHESAEQHAAVPEGQHDAEDARGAQG